MRVVFSCLQNCSGCKDDDFRDDGREFQPIGQETAEAREPNVTVLVRGKLFSLAQLSSSNNNLLFFQRQSTF